MSSFIVQTVPVAETELSDLGAWLVEQAKVQGQKHHWLLAHADDGVVWGRVDAAGLHTSSQVAPEVSPPLRAATLQQARLFGPGGELLLWRSDDGWQARLLSDGVLGSDYCDEDQIVWGTEAQAMDDGFTLLREGSEERLHAVPLTADSPAAKERRIRLCVRHYLDYNEDGEARIAASRLLDLVVKP